MASCVYPISEGMEIKTNSPKVLDSRRKTLQLLLSNHERKCLSCVRSGNCELQQLAKELGVEDEDYYDGEKTPSCIDDSAVHMIRDNSKCILCRRCICCLRKSPGNRCHRSQQPWLSTPPLVLRLKWVWERPPVFPVDSVLQSARPAHFRKNPRWMKFLLPLPTRLSM